MASARGGALLFCLAIVLVVTPAEAQGADGVFTVSGVEVDATAATAASARDQALAQGMKTALHRLLDRIVLAADRDRLPPVDGSEVSQLVRDFEVSGEKTSPVRYLAVLRVRFKPDGVRDYLRLHKVGFAETLSRPVLVLPVFEVSGAFSLWGQPNPWREAWQALPPSDGLVPLLRPKGDFRDVALIGAEQAVRGDSDRLAAIATRYGAKDVLVAVAGLRMGAVGPQGQPAQAFLQVTLSRMGTAALEQTRLESFAVREGESADAVVARAAAFIAKQIQEEWKSRNRLRFGSGNELKAKIPITSLADWLDIKRRLAGIAFIRHSELVYLSRNEARLKVSYIGDERQLMTALVQNDLLLERGPLSWTIRRAAKEPAVPLAPPEAPPAATLNNQAVGSP